MLPVGLVNVYARMLPRLRAQELLDQSGMVALGSGTMKEHDQRQLRNTLMQQAQKRKAPASVRETVLAAKAMGIKVIHRGS